jgi:hypothetical protein
MGLGGFNMIRVFWLGLLLSFAVSGVASAQTVAKVGGTLPSTPTTDCFSLIRDLDSVSPKGASVASTRSGEQTQSCSGTERFVLFEQTKTVLSRLGGGGGLGSTQSITITGRRWSDGWSTACIGSDCRDLLDELARPSVEPLRNPAAEFFVVHSGVRDHEVGLCSQVFMQPNDEKRKQLANTTSRSEPAQRYAAAQQAWNTAPHVSGPALNSIRPSPGNAIGATGYALNGGLEVTMTYSDGGSEVFRVTASTSHVDFFVGNVLEGSHKQGDGVSKCSE